MVAQERALNDLLAFVHSQRGLDFSQYKDSFLHRRLAIRMRARAVESFQEYLAVLRAQPAELDALLNALTINVSYFFRDRSAIEVLKRDVLEPLVSAKAAAGQLSLTVWSAGCAVGEEPYSIAMMVDDVVGEARERWRVVIHATDVDEGALARARDGIYSAAAFSPSGGPVPVHMLQAHYVARYFTYQDDTFTLRSEIRRMVTFRHHDLTTPPPLPRYDLILCRNVLIYFAREYQEVVVRHLINHLEPGGYLMLGMAEMLPLALIGVVEGIDGRHRIYRKPVVEAGR